MAHSSSSGRLRARLRNVLESKETGGHRDGWAAAAASADGRHGPLTDATAVDGVRVCDGAPMAAAENFRDSTSSLLNATFLTFCNSAAAAPTPPPSGPVPPPDAPVPPPDAPVPSPDAPDPSPDAPAPSPDAPTLSPDAPAPSPDAPARSPAAPTPFLSAPAPPPYALAPQPAVSAPSPAATSLTYAVTASTLSVTSSTHDETLTSSGCHPPPATKPPRPDPPPRAATFSPRDLRDPSHSFASHWASMDVRKASFRAGSAPAASARPASTAAECSGE